ncbi:NAD(P)-dependent oxidoreductase [Paenibacillus radicis (ex Xue et al. 2023)]|uniref:NAD(P)-dependent oxidoreductase n=1 Tax=Paenibacillus radicis (ex Xue et al. 2023) TaxID=2972489 RepID=A0ABT1YEJ2_9BACL|nr:NAD(P)-dependent oxidoreductase [Paenibacillus radicis (ex Xue et al. 2023)]MCR8631175.1 NAD(P)-dependent oxidoreductase [Paenibacillus radicis (ex Xue et al. 2023)]
MKIALMSASGTIGQRILEEALMRGHQVTAIVRDPSRITKQNENLTVVTGNIFEEASVAKAVVGHDVVISAFGPAFGSGEEHTLVEATRALIKGVKSAGVDRLLAVGGAASLEVAPGVLLIDTPEFPEIVKPTATAHRDALDVYRQEKELNWTNLSPAAKIAPGERTGKYRTGTEQLIVDEKGESYISAEDYAIAMLDEVEKPQYSRQRFTVGY